MKNFILLLTLFVGLNFSSPLFSNSPQLIIPNAITLNNNGFFFLSQIIDKDLQEIYSHDNQYLSHFPFSAYPVANVPGQGKFFINKINDTIKNRLRGHFPWESAIQSLMEQYIQPGKVAIDIGSHIGTHTVTMSKCIGANGSVFAFEPNPKIHRELCMNLALNHCANVKPIRCAIGKEKGTIQVITSHPQNEGGSYVIKENGGTHLAAMVPLDEFHFTDVSFIKIDVENMEGDVIDGAKETILQCRPILLVEIQGNLERPIQLGEDTEKMKEISIQKIIDLGYHLTQVGFADYLAFPN